MSTPLNLAKVRSKYDALVSPGTKLLESLNDLLSRELSRSQIHLAFPIEARFKTWTSVAAKLASGTVNPRKVQRMRDLIGLRLVVLFQRDLDAVGKLIERWLTVTSVDNSAEKLQPMEFGYSSIHYVVDLSEGVPTLTSKDCFGFQAEIQVRILAQHIWADTSHKLQYKSEDSVPNTVKRPLHRVAALLEVVDLELERVLLEREKYIRAQAAEPDDASLNVDNLEAVLRHKLPDGIWIEDHPMSEILQDLAYFNIETRGKLSGLLDTWNAVVLKKGWPGRDALADDNDSPVVSEPEADYDDSPGDYSPGGWVHTMLAWEFPEKYKLYTTEKIQNYWSHVGIDPEWEPPSA